jgi:Na+-translocating ferredoxin:NAD+ oxidoreductase subunit E
MPKKSTPLIKEFTKGILRENPVLRLLLGMCPSLAVTISLRNGLGMGLAALIVLLGSNISISLLRGVIPEKVRIPSFIVIIAGFVTIVQMLMQAFLPDLNRELGIFIPLIVVNCIILARAEVFASKSRLIPSILDALGMGIGFTSALVLIGAIREILGSGTLLGLPIPIIQAGGQIEPMLVFILPPGGFFVFGILIALSQKLMRKFEINAEKKELTLHCGSCTICRNEGSTKAEEGGEAQ